MAGETIALQAGQNIPFFGPDWNAINQAQRTAISVQQANLVMQAQNALKAFSADQSNFDPKTGDPLPNKLMALGAVSPLAQQEMTKNYLAFQHARDQHSVYQSEAYQGWIKDSQEVGLNALNNYRSYLKEYGDPKQAMDKAAGDYNAGKQVLVAAGLPKYLQDQWQPFDPVRIEQTQLALKQRKEVLELQSKQQELEQQGYKAEVEQDPKTGQPRRVWIAPGKPTLDQQGNKVLDVGLPVTAKEPERFIVDSPTLGQGINAIGDPSGGYRSPSGQLIKDATNPRKVSARGAQDAEGAMTPTGPTDLHGEDYLKALPASRAALIKGYAEGRVPIPSSFALGKPAWEKVIADLTQYDPSFDAVNYNARAATRKDFTSGKSAQNITSFNTAIGHLGTLEKAAEDLKNTNFPAYNYLANFLASNTGDPRVVKFNTAKQAVSDELTRAFRGTGGNVYDIKGWEENLSAANSPAQLRDAVKQAVNLLRSRIESVGEQYKRGMGTTADVMDLLTPAAKKTLESLPGGEDLRTDKETQIKGEGDKRVKPPQQGGVYVLGPDPDADYNALEKGEKYRGPDGVVRTK